MPWNLVGELNVNRVDGACIARMRGNLAGLRRNLARRAGELGRRGR
ncbi:MAG: hypothetical protein OEP95_03320 [Myxococcales bacterium]|nr:hypothetical protein [Myxococcales bacterium]